MDLIFDWDKKKKFKSKIKIHDETLRDGLQAPYVHHPSRNEKVKLVSLMEELGFYCSNIGFPASSNDQLNDCVAIAREKKSQKWNISLMCAARTKIEDIIPVIKVSQLSSCDIEVGIFIGSSNIRKLVENWDIKQMGKRVRESIKFAVSNGLKVMFVTEDTTRAHPQTLEYLYKTALDEGATKLCIADTVGYATGTGVNQIIKFFRKKILPKNNNGKIKLEWHGHNDRGLSLANALTALEAGVNIVETTALGVGERSGNTPTEILLANIWMNKPEIAKPSALNKYVKFASKSLHFKVPVNHPVYGREAFSTGSGVHAAAVLKALEMNREDLAGKIYSGIDSNLIGKKPNVRLTKMSGKASALLKLKLLNIPQNGKLVKILVRTAKKSRKILTDKEIKMIASKTF